MHQCTSDPTFTSCLWPCTNSVWGITCSSRAWGTRIPRDRCMWGVEGINRNLHFTGTQSAFSMLLAWSCRSSITNQFHCGHIFRLGRPRLCFPFRWQGGIGWSYFMVIPWWHVSCLGWTACLTCCWNLWYFYFYYLSSGFSGISDLPCLHSMHNYSCPRKQWSVITHPLPLFDRVSPHQVIY